VSITVAVARADHSSDTAIGAGVSDRTGATAPRSDRVDSRLFLSGGKSDPSVVKVKGCDVPIGSEVQKTPR